MKDLNAKIETLEILDRARAKIKNADMRGLLFSV